MKKAMLALSIVFGPVAIFGLGSSLYLGNYGLALVNTMSLSVLIASGMYWVRQ